jgi:DNA topoisomerase-2
MIAKNAIVDDIIKAIGLKLDVDYTVEENYKKLRYGQVLIITDADVDGIHITGLIQNLFHSLFPSVLRREKPFLTAMQTLIGKVNIGKHTEFFYNEQNFRKFLDENRARIKKDSVKYYKGLATNNEEEVPDTFGKKLVNFVADEKCNESMNLAFHKKFTDERKEWLKTFDTSVDVMKWENGNTEESRELPLTSFVEKELIKFSLDDCGRSLPNLMDGLKTSQRKILYGTILRNLKHSSKVMKVAQLGSSVAELTAYHHGEQNLVSTIIGMAQAFIGSNNIPLLFRDGQFGSRVQGGKDAGAGRYIYTKQDELTRLLFRPEDDGLLTYLDVDGEQVEPEFFVPILPTILVNGASGIGTGWSCDIPLYNPLDIVKAIRIWLRENGKVFLTSDNGIEVSLLPRLIPWYREFSGKIEMTPDSTKFLTHGRVELVGKKYVISELPVGVWTNDYKEFLESLLEDKRISKLENHSTLQEVKFTITEGTMKLTPENLNLTSSLRTTNMCIFDEQNSLRRFENTEQIIDAFCKVRYTYYTRRREKLILDLKHQISLNENKRRFLLELIAKTISLSNESNEARPTDEIEVELTEKNYYSDPESKFAYLLNMQLRSVTRERIDNLADEIFSLGNTLEQIKAKNETSMWLSDLEEFEKEYEKWLPKIRNEKQKKKGK